VIRVASQGERCSRLYKMNEAAKYLFMAYKPRLYLQTSCFNSTPTTDKKKKKNKTPTPTRGAPHQYKKSK
jgi:hypothetical protein